MHGVQHIELTEFLENGIPGIFCLSDIKKSMVKWLYNTN